MPALGIALEKYNDQVEHGARRLKLSVEMQVMILLGGLR